MKISGADLLKLQGVKVFNPEKIRPVNFSGVSIDSRKCRKNELFFAIRGERFDAHDFIKDVLKKGTRFAAAEKKWFKKLSASEKSSFKNRVVLVDDTIRSLGELARNHRKKFLIPVIGIAGSNGKTSVKDFVAHVLSTMYNVLKTEGNLNNAIGVPLTLFRLNADHDLAVIELGTNHFGEVDYLCQIAEPQLGIVTNIGKEHLEFLKNINGVLKAEGELIEYLNNNFGTYFLNVDDKYLVQKMKGKELRVIKYGTKANAEINGKINKYRNFYPEIEIKLKRRKIKTTLNTIGSQSFNAALCAAAVGNYFDVPAEKISAALGNFESVTSKRNQLKNVNGVYIIDDTYNSNPDSVMMALENLKQYKTAGEKHVVLADMLELGASGKREHFETGRLVKKMGFKNLYTFGKESFNTFRGAKGVTNNFYFEDKASLTDMLLHTVKKGDILLVKGSRSMKMEEVVNKFILERRN